MRSRSGASSQPGSAPALRERSLESLPDASGGNEATGRKIAAATSRGGRYGTLTGGLHPPIQKEDATHGNLADPD